MDLLPDLLKLDEVLDKFVEGDGHPGLAHPHAKWGDWTDGKLTVLCAGFRDLELFVMSNSDHVNKNNPGLLGAVYVSGYWQLETHNYHARIRCIDCDRQWVRWAPDNGPFLRWFTDVIWEGVEEFIEEPCFRLADQGALAEWLAKTLRLRRDRCMSYDECRDVVTRLNLAPPAVMDQVIRQMDLYRNPGTPHPNYRPGQVLLELPEGHPWRDW